MKFKKSRIINSIFFCFIILSFYSCGKTSSKKSSTYTLLVSMDGFRWDYEQMAETPTLDSIARTGVKAASLIPSFPTKTFPNHYTLATGLYPDHHGIVLNGFYAPDLEKYYAISKRESVENPAFYNGEPIWVSAEKQDLITASYFWVGSETPIEGIQPTYWKQYEHNFPFEQRVDSVIKWLNLPYAKRPHLVMLYFHEPDHVGHVYGPESDSTLKTVESLDALLGRLCKKLRQLDIADSLNLIVLSDHGMASFDDVVFLDDHIDTAWFEEIQGWNPNYVFKAKSDYYDTAFAVLSAIPGMHLWKHGELPNRLHYGNNPRTLDFIAAAKKGKGLMFSWNYREEDGTGAHGYDNQLRDMHTIFYGSGPDFKKNYNSKAFENVHIYSLLAEILGITPAQTDGSIDSVRHILKP